LTRWGSVEAGLGRTAILLVLLTAITAGATCCAGPALPNALESELASVPSVGIDSAVWAQLTSELKRVIEQEGTSRRTAAAPTGFGSRVPDLSLHNLGTDKYFTWSYRQHGDYDLNGDVNVSDLTQVGVHFGKTSVDDDWQVAQLADGDGNGEVGVSDVTPIGQNFGGVVHGYELQSRPDPGSPYAKREEYAFVPGDKLTGIYPEYQHLTTFILSGPDYRVVPYVEGGSGREYGVESNIYETAGGEPTWTTHRGNNHRDGQALTSGPAAADEVWEVELEGGTLFNEPVVGDDGTIFVTTMGTEDLANEVVGRGYLYAIHPDGTLWWRFRTPRGMVITPATCRRGRVVMGDLSGMVYCLAPDGKQIWRSQIAGMLYLVGPLLEDDGTAYIVSHTLSGMDVSSSTLYKLTAAGAIDWSRPLNAPVLAAPFHNSTGHVTLVDEAGELYSYGDDGVLAYNFMLPDSPSSYLYGFGVAFRGVAVIYCTDGDELAVVAENNSITWIDGLGETPVTPPSIGNDDRIVFGTQTTGPDPVQKLNRYDGVVEQWDMDVAGNMMSHITIDDSDTMYYTAFHAHQAGFAHINGIYCVLPDQTTPWFHPTGENFPFAPIIADENLIVCLVTEGWFTSSTRSFLTGVRSSQ